MRTLNFIRGKIKNESIDKRLVVLSALINEFSEKTAPKTFPADVPQVELFQLYNDLIQDVLEAPDLDLLGSDQNPATHPVLRFCFAIGREAIHYALQIEKKEAARWDLFNFGVEVQWKLSDFKLGRRNASIEFRIMAGPQLLPKITTNLPVLEDIVNHYIEVRLSSPLPVGQKRFA